MMTLPQSLQQVLDDAMSSVQNHPAGELDHTSRRAIYDVLWSESTQACQWAAILTARRVQPIYENKWADLMIEEWSHDSGSNSQEDLRLIIRTVANDGLSDLENLF